MVLFTHDIKKIKGADHKSDDIGGMCKRRPRPRSVAAGLLLPKTELI